MNIKKIILVTIFLAIPYTLIPNPYSPIPIPSLAVPGQLIYNVQSDERITPPLNCNNEIAPYKMASEKNIIIYKTCLRDKSQIEQQYAINIKELLQEKKKIFALQIGIISLGIIALIFISLFFFKKNKP